MKKIFIILVGMFMLTACGVTNKSAEKDKESNLYFTVINKTGKIINEIIVTSGEGTEIEKIEDPSEKSTSIKIPKEHADDQEFTVIIVDRYGTTYKVERKIKKKTGRIEIPISQDDKDESGNILDDIFNKD